MYRSLHIAIYFGRNSNSNSPNYKSFTSSTKFNFIDWTVVAFTCKVSAD